MNGNDKEVDYDTYCKKCKFLALSEDDDPCYECLDCPTLTDSNKPIKFIEKK